MNKTGFIAYMESIDLAPKTIEKHVKYAEKFFARVKKEDIQVTKPDILKFLEYLKNSRKLENKYRSDFLVSLNHYFTFLYDEGTIAENPCWFLKIQGTNKKKLHKIYTPEELDQLFDNYYLLFVRNYDDSGKHWREHSKIQAKLAKERNALILSIFINQGATTDEIRKIELDDIDFIKAKIKIRGGKKLNDRFIPLKATQIGLLMNYLQNIRPQLLEYQTTESKKLILSLPATIKTTRDDNLFRWAFNALIKQLKSIDKQFINFLQVRTSVITNWIKTEGLRKAQYMAGHRYISTTEKYLPNNLDELIDDINKLHPF